MSQLPRSVPLLLCGCCALSVLRAQPANSAAFGSSVLIWSTHTTVRERVDDGVNERIEIWSRRWVVSPSGRTYADTSHYGYNGVDGSSTVTVVLNEVGRWSYWSSDGGSLDSFRYGDTAASWYMFPHNPPNGVGYGGAGLELASYIDVQPAPTYSLSTSVSGSGTVSGAGTYAAGTVVSAAATPSPGWVFLNWQGDASGTGNPVAIAMDGHKSITAVFQLQQPANAPPTISWIGQPGTVASGQAYTISARGHDADGNLTNVDIYRNGAPFAFAGGGNGTDGDAGNTTSDTGPQTITYTAQATDSSGAKSPWIAQTVNVSAPPAVTASISASPDTDTAPGSTVISWTSANATSVAVSGNGLSSSNPSGAQSVSGLPTGIHTYTITAQGYGGPVTRSATFSVDDPPAVTAAISASPASAVAPGATTITWSTANATAVSVSGSGLASSAASGSQMVSGLAAGTHTYTVVAQGFGGPVTQTATFIVDAPTAVGGVISVTPTSATAPGSTTVSWSTNNATSVSVSGEGLSSSSPGGSQAVSGLPAGTHTYTLTAQGPGGPITRTATFTVSAAASVTASIAANPASATAPGSTTVSWTSANATSVSVSGSGLTSSAPTGSQTIAGLPAGTYTYTITAQGPGGPITRTATFIVDAPAAVGGSISVTPASATAPGSTTVSWSTNNATSVSVSGEGLNSSVPGGSQTVSGLPAGTHTYTLTAQGVGGPITRTATFTVSAAASVTASIAANPSSATAPGTTTVSWTSANATSVSVSGPGLASAAPGGSQTVSGLAPGTHTFTLVAQGPGGPLTRTATVAVSAAGPAVTGSISISPTAMNAGGTATLTWTTSHATSVRVTGFGVSGGPYESFPSFSMGIGGLPPGTFTYTLVAQGDGGPLTRTATIVVNSVDGLGASLTIVPPVIASNQSATMSWTITGANFRWVHGWQPGYNGVSIYPAPATGSTTLSGLSPGTYSYTIEYGPDLYYGSRQTFAYLTVLGVNRTVSTSVAPAGTGTVTGAGTYPEGASATLAATPGPAHVFSHWSGDLAGTANPLTFTIGAQNYAVTANFAPANYTLITAASGGGSVTPGGTYPAGSSVTISADGGGIARFTGWTGDASGSSNPLLVTMNADKAITGLFTPKLAQTIAFSPPATVRLDAAGSVVIPLTATASSGLPVSLALLSGPANLAGTTLAITGAGAVVVQAAQGGDATFLPAPTVTRTINGSAAGGLLQEPPGDKVHATDLPGNATLIRTR